MIGFFKKHRIIFFNAAMVIPISMVIGLFLQGNGVLRSGLFLFFQNGLLSCIFVAALSVTAWIFLWPRLLYILGANTGKRYSTVIRNELTSVYIFSLLGLQPLLKSFLPQNYHASIILYYTSSILITISLSLFIAYKYLTIPFSSKPFEIKVNGFSKEIKVDSTVLKYLPVVLMAAFFLLFFYLNSYLIIKAKHVGIAIVNIFNAIMKGDFLYTVNDFNRQLNIFGYYLAPLWLVLAPVAYLFNNNLFLLYILQGGIILLGAIPILKFARMRLGGNFSGIIFLLSYLLSFYIQTAHLWSVEIRTMSTAAMSWALYCLFTGKDKEFLLLVVIFLLCGTPGAITVIGLGLYLILKKGRRKLGSLTCLLAILYFYCGTMLAKSLSGGKTLYDAQFKQLLEMVSAPSELVSFLFSPQHLILIILTLLYYGFFPLLEFPLFIVIVPVFYVNYLIFHGPNSVLLSSYGLVHIVPIVIFAAIIGLDRARKSRLFAKRFRISPALNIFLLSSVIVTYLFFNPFRHQGLYWPERFARLTQQDFVIYRYLESIPRELSVCSDERYRFALGNRREIYMFNSNSQVSAVFKYPQIKDSDVVVVSRHADADFKNFTRERLFDSDDYGVEKYFEGIIVFKKGLKTKFNDIIKTDPKGLSAGGFLKFNDELELINSSTDKKVYKRNEVIRVTLLWKVLKRTESDYWFIIKLKKLGVTVKEYVHEPFYGFLTTSELETGGIYKDELELCIPSTAILSYEPLFLEIYAVKPLNAENNRSFLESLKKFYTVREGKELLNENMFGVAQLEL